MLSTILGYFIIVCLGGVLLLYTYLNKKYKYWSSRGIPTPPYSFLFGNMKETFLLKKYFGDQNREIYNEMKPMGRQFAGFYFGFQPVFLPLNAELVKLVLTKDFDHFFDRGLYCDEEIEPMAAHLFNLNGEKWKTLRQKLTPTFTSGKMKMMFQTVLVCCDQLVDVLDDLAVADNPVELKEYMSRFAIDIIGNCAFGIECNSLRDPQTDFYKFGRLLLEPGRKEQIALLVSLTAPEILRFFKIPTTNQKAAQFFFNVVKETVEYREKNNVTRNDFMHLLLQLRRNQKIADSDELEETDLNGVHSDCESLTLHQIAAQSILFFLAGFETSSTTLQFLFYELAIDESMQNKLRQEIVQVLSSHNGKITYESISNMDLLHRVVSETLRKYPAVAVLNRECTKDYKLPDDEFTIEKGTKVFIPVYAMHMDPDMYPDPEKFNPDRFSDEAKQKRHPYAYLPFGDGPRNCIGMRFGLLQVKLAVITIIVRYKVSLSSRTKLPFDMDPKNFMMCPKGGIWFNINKL